MLHFLDFSTADQGHRNRGGGGNSPCPSDFGRYVNPILINGEGRLSPQHYYFPPSPDFQTFLRPCRCYHFYEAENPYQSDFSLQKKVIWLLDEKTRVINIYNFLIGSSYTNYKCKHLYLKSDLFCRHILALTLPHNKLVYANMFFQLFHFVYKINTR